MNFSRFPLILFFLLCLSGALCLPGTALRAQAGQAAPAADAPKPDGYAASEAGE